MPGLKALAKKYAKKGLVVVGPSLDAEDAVKSYQKDHEIAYPLLADARETARAFQVQMFPTMFLVGKDGKVKWKGHFEDEALAKTLKTALAVKTKKKK